MQQLCSFVSEDKKISNKFILLKTEDIKELSEFTVLGCRVIVLVQSGSIALKINGKWHTMGKDAYLDILEGTRIQFGDCSPDLYLRSIITTRDFIMEVLKGIVAGPNNYMFKVMINPTISLIPDEVSVMMRQMDLLDGVLQDLTHFQREEMVRIYFRSFALELGNILIKHKDWEMPSQVLAKRDMIMANFMDLVWKNFRTDREVSFYAKELCVSTKHLSRIVKESSGKTPHEIIAHEVIALSMQLLRNEGMLIQQISDILHFSDQAAFSKFFKKYLKVSPAEYRRRLQ